MRGCAQRFTTSGSFPGSTSTPSPGPSIPSRAPLGLRTATRPFKTRTEVRDPWTSTAHFVPRTAAIACGVVTRNRVFPGWAGASTSNALLCRSTALTRPPRSAPCNAKLAPFSAMITTPSGQRTTCVLFGPGCDWHALPTCCAAAGFGPSVAKISAAHIISTRGLLAVCAGTTLTQFSK
jgi:hypothetical protein